MNEVVREIEKEIYSKPNFPDFKAGDTVNIHVKIKEGNKERVQQFQGTVIQRKGSNTSGETFTVREVSGGIGIERIFPLLSPSIDKIQVIRKGKVRQSRLYYLQGRQGKAARIKENIKK